MAIHYGTTSMQADELDLKSIHTTAHLSNAVFRIQERDFHLAQKLSMRVFIFPDPCKP
ncbi:MAG: hypothetical protein ACKVIB_13535 [Pseudomonadales bacterium]|jgi:hypothetical protein